MKNLLLLNMMKFFVINSPTKWEPQFPLLTPNLFIYMHFAVLFRDTFNIIVFTITVYV